MTKQRALLIILLLGIMALLGAVVSILVGYLTTLLPSWLTTDPLRIWGLIAVLVTLSALLGYWVYRLQSDSDEKKQALTSQNRRNLLTKVRFHVTDFFEDSLHGAALLVLGLQKEPDAGSSTLGGYSSSTRASQSGACRLGRAFASPLKRQAEPCSSWGSLGLASPRCCMN